MPATNKITSNMAQPPVPEESELLYTDRNVGKLKFWVDMSLVLIPIL